MQTALLVLALCGQEDLTVFRPDEQPDKRLYAHLQAECAKHFDARRKVIEALKTPEDLKRRQEELRAKFIQALGGFPERTPLHPRATGTLKGGGFRVEKVIYESRPDHHVTGALYLPDGAGPHPGVLVPCGHSENGKAVEAYQRACILLAKHGFAVLCYDPIGQGERKQLLDEKGQAAIKGSTNEHTMSGLGALLVGRSAAGYRVWDGIRSLDYLAGRPEVDPERLGCAGNSGGGTLTAYLMALDERILAAAPSCYVTTLERLFATIGPQDAEQNITGQVAFGMEHSDYVTMRAPRPTLINIGSQDYFDQAGSWTTYREAKRLYSILGFGERVDLFEFDDKHGWSKPRRESALRWMRRWLQGKDDAAVEGDFPVFKDAELQCTKTGQVLSEFKGKSVFDLNAVREGELSAGRGKKGKAELLKGVSALIGLERPSGAAVLEGRGESRRGGVSIKRGLAKAKDGMPVPWLCFDGGGTRALLYVHDAGKAKEAGPGGAIEALVKDGHVVTAIDLRGTGETNPGGTSSGYGRDSQAAFLGLHLSRSLLGQRVAEVLAFATAKDVKVAGVGAAGPVVLHAAALEPAIAEVTIEGGLVSWASVVKTPISRNQLANVVPGALEVYDLPDLAAAIAPRPLAIRNPVDAAGRPLTQAELEAAYAGAREAYKALGAEKNLVLEAKR